MSATGAGLGRGRAVELTLSWQDGRWRAVGADLDLLHADLSSLDALIVGALSARPGPRRPARANVRFDAGGLPAWLRQYQPHYFNYALTIDGGDGA